MWCGKPVPLELDHIDGDPENNVRENLRLICPNCHAQTPTYKGKNVGKVKNSKRQGILKKYRGKYR
jgi:5-methylcytosine-specific restriction endonuclease McrA